jgi:hypothetical protein
MRDRTDRKGFSFFFLVFCRYRIEGNIDGWICVRERERDRWIGWKIERGRVRWRVGTGCRAGRG